MWKTDPGYFGVPNGEQVKAGSKSQTVRPGFYDSICASRVLYAASSVCTVFPVQLLTLERVYVARLQATMKRRE